MSLTAEDPVIKDAVSALIALGYQPREARQAVFKSGVDLRAKPAIEEVIKQSLRVLS
jgi:Holliday junction resolvasome RuvABC DNA-binding subunit